MTDVKHDYIADVRKYSSNVNEAAVAGIVRHLGIALQHKDSSLVSASDKTELDRVRDGFMKKKLGLTDSDSALDTALGQVMKTMAADHNKSRVVVCYLLAEKFDKLSLFVKA